MALGAISYVPRLGGDLTFRLHYSDDIAPGEESSASGSTNKDDPWGLRKTANKQKERADVSGAIKGFLLVKACSLFCNPALYGSFVLRRRRRALLVLMMVSLLILLDCMFPCREVVLWSRPSYLPPFSLCLALSPSLRMDCVVGIMQ